MSHLPVLLRDVAVELLDSSLLAIGVIAKLHHFLQQSVETESKIINVLTWLEGQVLLLLAELLQYGLAGAIAADACCSNGVPSFLGSPLAGKRELHLGRDCSDEGIRCLSILVEVDVVVPDYLPHVQHLKSHLHRRSPLNIVGLGEDRLPTTRANIPDNSLVPVVATVPVRGESHAACEGHALPRPVHRCCHARLLHERCQRLRACLDCGHARGRAQLPTAPLAGTLHLSPAALGLGQHCHQQ